MPKDYSRSERVADQIQRELAQLIQQEIQDPRVHLVTVSAVRVSKDLSQATVFVSSLDKGHEIKEQIEALNHAAGFLRHGLAQRMRLRVVPNIRFRYDESIERGVRLTHLIDELNAGTPESGQD